MTADELTRRAIIAARQSTDASTEHYNTLTVREAAIVEAWRADLDKLTERIERYQRLDVIHMKNQLRMTRTLDEALGLAEADCDMCVPGCDEGAQGAEHLMHHLIERDAERGAAIERVRALADEVENRMMATAKPSEIRAAIDGTEADHG